MSVDCWNNLSNICYLCLCNKSELLQLASTKRTGTESWISKLITCVTEIKWSKEYCICLICSNQLEFVYKFRRLCLDLHEQRKNIFERPSQDKSALTKSGEFAVINVKLEASGGTEEFVCKDCGLEFSNTEELHKHSSKLHTKDEDTDLENIIDCLSNDNSSSSVDSWKPQRKKITKTRLTYRAKHGQKSKEIIKLKQGRTKKQTSKNKDITNSTLKCYTCEQEFDTIMKLVRHSRIEHNITRKDVKPYACNKCDRRFTIPCKLKVHLMYHDGIRNEICSHCGKGFPTKKALHVHEQIHQNREYQCSYCPKKFNTKGNRRGHERTVHLDPSKWFACHICGKKFNKKDNLIGHIRRHTNEKPFACQVCNMRFCSSTDLRMHSKTHSNVRQYKCSECDKDYKYRNQLNYHLTRTHNIYR